MELDLQSKGLQSLDFSEILAGPTPRNDDDGGANPNLDEDDLRAARDALHENVARISATDNIISFVGPLHYFQALSEVDLSHNRLTVVRGDVWPVSLKKLDLSFNQLEHIAFVLQMQCNLQWLSVVGNELRSLGWGPYAEQRAKELSPSSSSRRRLASKTKSQQHDDSIKLLEAISHHHHHHHSSSSSERVYSDDGGGAEEHDEQQISSDDMMRFSLDGTLAQRCIPPAAMHLQVLQLTDNERLSSLDGICLARNLMELYADRCAMISADDALGGIVGSVLRLGDEPSSQRENADDGDDHDGAATGVKMMPIFPQLEVVDFSFNPLSETEIAFVMEALSKCAPKLDLSSHLMLDDCEKIFDAFLKMQQQLLEEDEDNVMELMQQQRPLQHQQHQPEEESNGSSVVAESDGVDQEKEWYAEAHQKKRAEGEHINNRDNDVVVRETAEDQPEEEVFIDDSDGGEFEPIERRGHDHHPQPTVGHDNIPSAHIADVTATTDASFQPLSELSTADFEPSVESVGASDNHQHHQLPESARLLVIHSENDNKDESTSVTVNHNNDDDNTTTATTAPNNNNNNNNNNNSSNNNTSVDAASSSDISFGEWTAPPVARTVVAPPTAEGDDEDDEPEDTAAVVNINIPPAILIAQSGSSSSEEEPRLSRLMLRQQQQQRQQKQQQAPLLEGVLHLQQQQHVDPQQQQPSSRSVVEAPPTSKKEEKRETTTTVSRSEHQPIAQQQPQQQQQSQQSSSPSPISASAPASRQLSFFSPSAEDKAELAILASLNHHHNAPSQNTATSSAAGELLLRDQVLHFRARRIALQEEKRTLARDLTTCRKETAETARCIVDLKKAKQDLAGEAAALKRQLTKARREIQYAVTAKKNRIEAQGNLASLSTAVEIAAVVASSPVAAGGVMASPSSSATAVVVSSCNMNNNNNNNNSSSCCSTKLSSCAKQRDKLRRQLQHSVVAGAIKVVQDQASEKLVRAAVASDKKFREREKMRSKMPSAPAVIGSLDSKAPGTSPLLQSKEGKQQLDRVLAPSPLRDVIRRERLLTDGNDKQREASTCSTATARSNASTIVSPSAAAVVLQAGGSSVSPSSPHSTSSSASVATSSRGGRVLSLRAPNCNSNSSGRVVTLADKQPRKAPATPATADTKSQKVSTSKNNLDYLWDTVSPKKQEAREMEEEEGKEVTQTKSDAVFVFVP